MQLERRPGTNQINASGLPGHYEFFTTSPQPTAKAIAASSTLLYSPRAHTKHWEKFHTHAIATQKLPPSAPCTLQFAKLSPFGDNKQQAPNKLRSLL